MPHISPPLGQNWTPWRSTPSELRKSSRSCVWTTDGTTTLLLCHTKRKLAATGSWISLDQRLPKQLKSTLPKHARIASTSGVSMLAASRGPFEGQVSRSKSGKLEVASWSLLLLQMVTGSSCARGVLSCRQSVLIMSKPHDVSKLWTLAFVDPLGPQVVSFLRVPNCKLFWHRVGRARRVLAQVKYCVINFTTAWG